MRQKTTEVVRVGVTNNFNCTTKEWAQVDHFAKTHPNKVFFINSNIRTPKLATIAKHPYKAVITANPDLIIDEIGIDKIMNTLKTIKKNVAFVRVKYVPERIIILRLIGVLLKENYPVVLTLQRFNSKETLLQYTDIVYYKFSCSRYRLDGVELASFVKVVKDFHSAGLPIYICDIKGEGCGGCGLCSILTAGKKLKISSLNLSTSGICPYNCVDCYAKTMQKFARSMGKPIIYDQIRQNDKQAGRLEHIKENKKVKV
jgi:hypothetical protein